LEDDAATIWGTWEFQEICVISAPGLFGFKEKVTGMSGF